MFRAKVEPSQLVELRRSTRAMLLTVLAHFPLTKDSPSQVRNTKVDVAGAMRVEPKAAVEAAAATLAAAVVSAKVHRHQNKTAMVAVVPGLLHYRAPASPMHRCRRVPTHRKMALAVLQGTRRARIILQANILGKVAGRVAAGMDSSSFNG